MQKTGKEKGKTGIVTKVYRNRNQVVVEGLNMVKYNFTLNLLKETKKTWLIRKR